MFLKRVKQLVPKFTKIHTSQATTRIDGFTQQYMFLRKSMTLIDVIIKYVKTSI